jgi:hypothetical protein
MTMKELRELLKGYSDDAEVVVVDRKDPSVKYPISGVDVQDWGTRFEIVITKEN